MSKISLASTTKISPIPSYAARGHAKPTEHHVHVDLDGRGLSEVCNGPEAEGSQTKSHTENAGAMVDWPAKPFSALGCSLRAGKCARGRGHKLISDSARLHNQTGMFAGICVLCIYIYIVVAIYIYTYVLCRYRAPRNSVQDPGHLSLGRPSNATYVLTRTSAMFPQEKTLAYLAPEHLMRTFH